MASSAKKASDGDAGKGKKFFGFLSSKSKKKAQKPGKDEHITTSIEPSTSTKQSVTATMQAAGASVSSTAQTPVLVTEIQKRVGGTLAESPLPIEKNPGIDLSTPEAQTVVTANPPENLPSTINTEHLSTSDLAGVVSRTSPETEIASTQTPKPIRELWNEAYEDLRAKESRLILAYEAIMVQNMATDEDSSNTSILDSSTAPRDEQMKALLERKLAQVKKDTWKLKFGDKEVPVKDLAAPVVGIIKWAEQYVSGAVSANPYASIAWAGVSLLLPLFLNPSKQAATLIKGLEDLSNIIVRSTVREDLYTRRCRYNDSSDLQEYRQTLKELYVRILKFQASTICYCSNLQMFRLGLDMIMWNDWDSLSNDIAYQELAFKGIYELWKDRIAQEESEDLSRRHGEIMQALKLNELIAIDVTGLRKAIEDSMKDIDRGKLLEWLTSVNPSSNYTTALGKPKADTGAWLIKQNSDFDRWKVASNSFIWLNGQGKFSYSIKRSGIMDEQLKTAFMLAGSGKSVLSSTVIKHLEECYVDNPNVALAYYFFSFNDTHKQTVDGMLRSLIKQLCCRRPDTPAPLQNMMKYKEMGHRPDEKTLMNTLLATIHGFSDVFIIIDALDECPSGDERENLLDRICEILSSEVLAKEEAKLHIFCTSRTEADIGMALKPLFSLHTMINIDLSCYQPAVEHDIGLHIDKMFAGRNYSSWPDTLKQEARNDLIAKAGGMFQYVACQFDTFATLRRPEAIRQALKDLPKGLDATYDRMLLKIDDKYCKIVANALKWLAFSVRPLILGEFAEVFIIDLEHEPPFEDDNRYFQPEDVLQYLPGLVTKVQARIEDTDYTEIRLAHFSIKEYLSSVRIGQDSDDPDRVKIFSAPEVGSHLHIAEASLVYHLHLSKTILATEKECRHFELWHYASQAWVEHLEKIPQESWTPSVTKLALQALIPKSQSLLNIVRICDPDDIKYNRSLRLSGRRIATHPKTCDFNWDVDFNTLSSPLFYALYWNLQLFTLLLNEYSKINEQTSDLVHVHEFATPEAALLARTEIILSLLSSAGDHGNAFQTAVFISDEKIIRHLLDLGAYIDAWRGAWGSALQIAAHEGKYDIAKLLLDRGADVNLQSGRFGNALYAAAWKGNGGILKLLIDRGAEVNSLGGGHGSALQAAAWGGTRNCAVFDVLLDGGADINLQGGQYGNALQVAAWRGHVDTCRVFLGLGADVHAQGGEFGNALQAAIAGNELEIVDLLRSYGAEIAPQDPQWKELLKVKLYANRLRKFQADPDVYLATRGAAADGKAAKGNEA